MNALVYFNIDQGIFKGEMKVARNEKQKKLHGFSFSINIANFEAFRWTKKLISNLFFLKSVSTFIKCNIRQKYDPKNSNYKYLYNYNIISGHHQIKNPGQSILQEKF